MPVRLSLYICGFCILGGLPVVYILCKGIEHGGFWYLQGPGTNILGIPTNDCIVKLICI